eukprot:CAMPEP_0204278324 /NCGR_PEP_ID=MMETSP0468-20130131/29803_1 /ASSEMBLY_ACC=CAM_ASM_000383 /TAXON_ID=2969 /ORGANISM="Oxyrrhis marina" /LENGTH=44 /DNA_ID= /DNA_START= /DNA_END= /DNA_ORIENTATION=
MMSATCDRTGRVAAYNNTSGAGPAGRGRSSAPARARLPCWARLQ